MRAPLRHATPSPARTFDRDTLLCAVRHHRRALTWLKAGAFEGLPPVTAEGLVQRLEADLRRLEADLALRGVPE